MHKKWIVYTRVSTEEQAREGASLDAQERQCRKYLELLDVKSVEAIQDPGASGKNLKRLGMRKVIDTIKAGEAAGVIVWKLDRLCRRTLDLLHLVELCQQHGTALASVQERIDTSGPMGGFMLTVMGAIAQLEREQIAERTSMGMQQRILDGCWVGGRVPPGLIVEKDEHGRKRLQACPTWGPTMAACWPMIIRGASIQTVIDHLKDSGLPVSGNGWYPQRLHGLLKSPHYIGRVVDADTHAGAQAALAERMGPKTPARTKKPIESHGERIWPLRGLAVCGHCGSALAGSSARSQNGGIHHYLRCLGRMRKGKAYCPGVNIRADDAETVVRERLAWALQQRPELRRIIRSAVARQHGDAAELASKLAALKKQEASRIRRLESMYDMWADEGGAELDRKVFRQQTGRIEMEVATIRDDIDDLEGRLAAVEVSAQHLQAVEDALVQAGRKIENMTACELATWLPRVVAQIIMTQEDMTLKIYEPPRLKDGTVRIGWLPGLDDVRTQQRVWTLVDGPLHV